MYHFNTWNFYDVFAEMREGEVLNWSQHADYMEKMLEEARQVRESEAVLPGEEMAQDGPIYTAFLRHR